MLINSGVITLNSFISPTDDIRHMAREIIGAENFFEIYVNAPLAVCEERDIKGLYKKARAGEIKNFTGIDSPFDPPLDCDLEIKTNVLSIKDSVELILDRVLERIEKI